MCKITTVDQVYSNALGETKNVNELDQDKRLATSISDLLMNMDQLMIEVKKLFNKLAQNASETLTANVLAEFKMMVKNFETKLEAAEKQRKAGNVEAIIGIVMGVIGVAAAGSSFKLTELVNSLAQMADKLVTSVGKIPVNSINNQVNIDRANADMQEKMAQQIQKLVQESINKIRDYLKQLQDTCETIMRANTGAMTKAMGG
ncbi:hypothetical protein [Candidatus Fukatsuia endosymbiont of Drepanosiphum platanoidis]|uniref:hypothetical protein n=1 Tax=Candidatus Fukatsuia endosymbiont of Drepanosiphum platanoidis TaxID=3077953 RepID=UPI00313AC449